MPPTILVTGARGMLGSAVLSHLQKTGVPAAGTDLPETDLTSEDQTTALLRETRPAHVIHCAAYTNVDKAESDAEAARLGNTAATENLARACAGRGASLLMVSTDYVFGDAPEEIRLRRPIPVNAPTAPRGVYARTKREAERVLAAALPRHQIVRTAWLFGPNGRHFVGIILDRLQKGLPLRVVNDQIGSPTYTPDLAERLVHLSQAGETGVFHLTNSGHCSWYEFACAIAELSGFAPGVIEPIPSSAWPSPVQRPAWSVLDCSRAEQAGAKMMRHWKEALREFLET